MRGYQKRVIYLKNTGSRNFEEAYFVVRDTNDGVRPDSASAMIDEANLIIDENFGKRKRGFLYTKRWYFLSFLMGFCLSFLISVIYLAAS